MEVSVAIRRALSRLGRTFAALVAALVVVTGFIPVALGPALSGATRALGGGDPHACACGMKAGTCGCPECERDLLGASTRLPVPHATLGSCDDHGRVSLAAGLPPATLPASLGVLVAFSARLVFPSLTLPRTPFEPTPPPTPPPRPRAA